MPPRRAPRSCICMRAIRRTAALARPRDVPAVPAAHQASLRRGDQHHHRRQRDHDGGGADRGRDHVLAGNVLAQHGLDELRALSDGGALQDLEARLGGAISAAVGPEHLPQHVPRHRAHRQAPGRRARRQVRARMLRHRPSLQSRPLRGPRAVQAADLSAADLRHPGRHRAGIRQPPVHEAHGRPPVRRPVRVVGAGRRPATRFRLPPWPP